MKKILFILAGISLMLLSASAFARRASARLNDGSRDVLKGVMKLNVQFEYGNMHVGNLSESDYLVGKKEKLNDKEPGRGDKWAHEWKADRQARFEPSFQNKFNSYSKIQLGRFPTAKYTLIFKTTFTEPGYNVGISSKPAYIKGEAWVVEMANQNNVICKIKVNSGTLYAGRFGSDFDTGERIKNSYAYSGKVLARFFKKNKKLVKTR